MTYLLDANVFIQAKNLHYGLDFCPAFWQWLLDNHAAGRVFSIDKVADEIAAGGDELTDWMRDHGNGLFMKTGAAVAAKFGAVSTWATQQQYEPAANSVKRIKIQNACISLNLHFMTPYEMLRRERARFVLGGTT